MINKNSNIGLYFGSFNPVHVGHLALANFIAENTELDEIWFVVSPQNPFKQSTDLIEPRHRIKMLEDSIEGYSKFKVCDIELNLPIPSYTYITLRELSTLHPESKFTIIMGGDNLSYLKRWKNAEEILEKYSFIVYPRPGYEIKENDLARNIKTVFAPVFDIDSTSIRKGISEGKSYNFLVPKNAHDYIKKLGLYMKKA